MSNLKNASTASKSKKSLLNPHMNSAKTLKIYFPVDDDYLVSVSISSQIPTTEEAISDAVRKLN